MKGSTVLVAVIMALLQDAQSSKTAIVNVAARSGQVANRVIQKMQRMDPNLIQNHLENSRLTFEKIKTSYHWFQKLRLKRLSFSKAPQKMPNLADNYISTA